MSGCHLEHLISPVKICITVGKRAKTSSDLCLVMNLQVVFCLFFMWDFKCRETAYRRSDSVWSSGRCRALSHICSSNYGSDLFIFLGPQISCFAPSNFSVKQASYVDTYCWDSLMHHEYDSDGNFEERSLWVHKVSVKFFFFTGLPWLVSPTYLYSTQSYAKPFFLLLYLIKLFWKCHHAFLTRTTFANLTKSSISSLCKLVPVSLLFPQTIDVIFFSSLFQMFPYSLLAMAILMYLPALIWRQLVTPTLGSDLLFIIDELDKSYNRSVRLAQSILDMRQNTKNPLTFQAELQR